MAFPSTFAPTASSITSAGTSLAVAYAADPVAGQLLVIFVRFAGAPGTITFTGYTAFAGPDSSDASDDSTALYYRLADGTEGPSDTISWVNSVKTAALAWRITDAISPATQPPQTSVVAVGTGANANSTIVTPTGGAKDYLFLVVLGMDGETQNATQPAGYNGALSNAADTGTGGAAATNCRMWGAPQQLNAASEDPAAWTSDAPTTGWTAWTVAVHPVPAAATNLFDAQQGSLHTDPFSLQVISFAGQRSNVY